MADQQPVSINLDHVLELLRSGVRRADVFMGMGLNAATHEPPISHLLTTGGLHTIRLVKEELSSEEHAHVAGEFGKWVRENGLRELIETFSIFLDRLYLPLFLMTNNVDGNGMKLAAPDRFEQLGIADKIDMIGGILAVSDAERRVLASLNQARNCYAHRRGVIGKRDVAPDTELARFIGMLSNSKCMSPTGISLSRKRYSGMFWNRRHCVGSDCRACADISTRDRAGS